MPVLPQTGMESWRLYTSLWRNSADEDRQMPCDQDDCVSVLQSLVFGRGDQVHQIQRTETARDVGVQTSRNTWQGLPQQPLNPGNN
jgi:hypothetical protein